MEKCSICFQSHHYWIIRMIFQNLQFYFYQIWALISAKKDSNIISLPKTETLPIGDIVISDWTTSTAEIMSQPVFCAFCVFRPSDPIYWRIYDVRNNQSNNKSIFNKTHLWPVECETLLRSASSEKLDGFGCALRWRNFDNWPYQGRSGWADWINLSRVI